MDFLNLSAIICVVLLLLYYYLTRKYDYWKIRNVHGPKPMILVGNMTKFFLRQESLSQIITRYYAEHKGNRYFGIFNGRRPVFVPRDLDLIKHILIKDFETFTDRGVKVGSEPPDSDNLFIAEGDTWRILRTNLSPTFTSGKIKNMFYLVNECGKEFQNYVSTLIDKGGEIELRDICGKYTLQVIGSCAFGIDVKALNDEKNVFRDIGQQIFNPSSKQIIFRVVEGLFPGFMKLFHIKPGRNNIKLFFDDLVDKIVEERNGKAKQRNDFMDLMLCLKEQGAVSSHRFKHDEEITLEITNAIMSAQATVFYAAGFETSSGTMAFLIHELSQNLDIQKRLCDEIDNAIAKYGDITYESLNEMPYLDMVFSETLRKYPVAGILARKCARDYNIPGSTLKLEQGTSVMIPVSAIHWDPEIYPEPEKFDPERFTAEAKNKRHPQSYIPFGDGPRNCIGARFAKVQSMVGVAKFLQKYQVEPTNRTPKKLKIDPTALTLTAKGGIWLNVKSRA